MDLVIKQLKEIDECIKELDRTEPNRKYAGMLSLNLKALNIIQKNTKLKDYHEAGFEYLKKYVASIEDEDMTWVDIYKDVKNNQYDILKKK